MDKLAYITILYDLYGSLLTEKQQQIWQMFYNDDLSLAEIAAEMNISRQAVHDSNRRAEEMLKEYEEKLGLYAALEDKIKVRSALEQAVRDKNWQQVQQALDLLKDNSAF